MSYTFSASWLCIYIDSNELKNLFDHYLEVAQSSASLRLEAAKKIAINPVHQNLVVILTNHNLGICKLRSNSRTCIKYFVASKIA